MPTCTVCAIEPPKYRCPKCLDQYCSVKCCKAHKEVCKEQPKEQITQVKTPIEDSDGLPPKPRPMNGDENDDDENDDRVSESSLQQLGESEELKSTLRNPHLRAMMENLVNTDRPAQALASAMQEPIFREFADVCLRLVDQDNPNLEPEGVS